MVTACSFVLLSIPLSLLGLPIIVGCGLVSALMTALCSWLYNLALQFISNGWKRLKAFIFSPFIKQEVEPLDLIRSEPIYIQDNISESSRTSIRSGVSQISDKFSIGFSDRFDEKRSSLDRYEKQFDRSSLHERSSEKLYDRDRYSDRIGYDRQSDRYSDRIGYDRQSDRYSDKLDRQSDRYSDKLDRQSDRYSDKLDKVYDRQSEKSIGMDRSSSYGSQDRLPNAVSTDTLVDTKPVLENINFRQLTVLDETRLALCSNLYQSVTGGTDALTLGEQGDVFFSILSVWNEPFVDPDASLDISQLVGFVQVYCFNLVFLQTQIYPNLN